MSQYTLFHTLCDAGFGLLAASRLVDVIQGRRHADDDEGAELPDEWRPEPEPFHPSPEDLEWLATHPIAGGAPADEPDWDEYAAWSAWQDALEASHPPRRR